MNLSFSVIIPYHNSHSTVFETVNSVLQQTSGHFEIIIVDDRSDQSSREFIDQLESEIPCLHVRTAKGHGPSAARNTGTDYAKGEFLWFLDADDILTPEAFERIQHAFECDANVGVAFGQVRITATPLIGGGVVTPITRNITLRSVLGENCTCTASNICVRRNAFFEIGKFDETLTHAEDQEWLARAFFNNQWKIKSVPHITVHYRTSIGGLSSDLKKMEVGWSNILSKHNSRIESFSQTEQREAKAHFYRYLARRSLRLGKSRVQALWYFFTAIGILPSLLSKDFQRTASIGVAAIAVAVFGSRPFRQLTS